MHTVRFLTLLVNHYQVLAYMIIFLGLIVEGEVVLITTGILSHLGALNVWFSLCFVLAGGLTKTFSGYYIGRIIHEKWNHTKLLKFIEKKVLMVMPHFNQKPFWSIFISKFIFGINYMVIILSGYEKIDFKKFLKAEICSTIVWAPALLALGYFFSYTALNVSREIWKFSLVILILVMLFFLFDKLIEWVYEIFEEFYEN